MMQFILILALGVAIVAVVFAVSNTGQTTVSFLGIEIYEGSLALVLLLSMLLGVLISILASSPSWVRNRMAIRNLNKQITQLKKDLDEQTAQLSSTQGKLEEAQGELELLKNPPPPEAITAQAESPAADDPTTSGEQPTFTGTRLPE